MSEEKKERSAKEIESEYQNLTFKSGALQYELDCKRKDLEMINDTLRSLAFEYIEAKKKEDAKSSESKE